ncbi:MAG TPA: hypothetical protein VG816_05535 [Solirubrobacterales bacterium]|nr:hypothetical protein [Solirubrobacterales bacterium]
MAEPNQTRPPRGALIVIAVGLLATVLAAVLANENLAGSVTTLEWVEKATLPDSKKAAIPGGGEMQLTRAEIRSSEANVSEYTLFRSSALLTISAGSAVGHARLRCAIVVPKRTIPAKTPKSRASYPRSSEELSEQETSETSAVEFSSHSTELASVEMGDIIGKRYTSEKGIVVEWAPYRIGQQVWKYGLPAGKPQEDLTLPFASIWRTTSNPAAKISCTVENAAGSATVSTAGKLDLGKTES